MGAPSEHQVPVLHLPQLAAVRRNSGKGPIGRSDPPKRTATSKQGSGQTRQPITPDGSRRATPSSPTTIDAVTHVPASDLRLAAAHHQLHARSSPLTASSNPPLAPRSGHGQISSSAARCPSPTPMSSRLHRPNPSPPRSRARPTTADPDPASLHHDQRRLSQKPDPTVPTTSTSHMQATAEASPSYAHHHPQCNHMGSHVKGVQWWRTIHRAQFN
ncbi:hypothetical protein ACLOJK_023557 [Asimina triloba]